MSEQSICVTNPSLITGSLLTFAKCRSSWSISQYQIDNWHPIIVYKVVLLFSKVKVIIVSLTQSFANNYCCVLFVLRSLSCDVMSWVMSHINNNCLISGISNSLSAYWFRLSFDCCISWLDRLHIHYANNIEANTISECPDDRWCSYGLISIGMTFSAARRFQIAKRASIIHRL